MPEQLQQQPPDQIYQFYGRNLYRLTGDESSDAIFDAIGGGGSVGANNSQAVAVSGSDIMSGVSANTSVAAVGSIQGGGKRLFDNTSTGYILGVDPKDGFAKFYIGNPANYLNWDGTTLTVKANISVSAIDIPDAITANSFHVDSSGNAWWGSTTLATSKAQVLNTGVATFAQSAGSAFSLVNSSGSTILDIGNNGSIIMRILPKNNDYSALLIQNDSSLVSTRTMFGVDTLNSSSSGTTVAISQAGTGPGLAVIGTSSDQTNYLVSISGSSYLRNLVEITSSFNSNSINTMLHITALGANGANTLMQLDNAGIGYTARMYITNNSNANYALFISYAGVGRVVEIDNTYSSNPNTVLYVTTNNTTALPIFAAGGTVSTHFQRMIGSGSYTIWVSDGTTPNGNLSGNVGDFCLGGNTSHPFYCTGTTNWTQI